jgi:hypothetical protein
MIDAELFWSGFQQALGIVDADEARKALDQNYAQQESENTDLFSSFWDPTL